MQKIGIVTPLLLVLVVLFTGGCAEIRKATYPQNFVYLNKQLVTGQMALMSSYMRRINEILADDSTISSEQQQKLVGLLQEIDKVTDRLGAGDTETNHLLIDDHIDDFKSDVNLAMRDVLAEPPSYFSLGKLAGSCNGCHRYR